KKVQAIIKSLVDAYDINTAGIQTIEVEGQYIRLQQMQSGAGKPVCIYREDWDKIMNAAGQAGISNINMKDDNWINLASDSQYMPGGGTVRVKATVKKLASMYDVAKGGIQ